MKQKIISLFLFGTAIATATSCFQLFRLTDEESGFFKTDYIKTGWMLSLFIIVVVICIGLVAWQAMNLPKKHAPMSPLFSLISVAYAILLVKETFDVPFISSFPRPLPQIYTVLCFLSALAVLLIGFNRYLRLNINGTLSLIVLAYAFIRLVLPFTRFSHMPTVAQSSYELCYLAMHLIFWLHASMLENGIRQKNTDKWFLSISLVSSCICVVYAVPELLAKLSSNPALHQGSADPVLAIVFAIYCFIYCFCMFKPRKRRTINTNE